MAMARDLQAMLLGLTLVALAHSELTFSNVEPRHDVNGEILNAHDGQIIHHSDGVYYWFAAGYVECVEFPGLNGCAGCTHGIGPSCGCGFEANTAVNLYTSTDMATWTSHGNVLPASERPANTSLFSPRAIFNERTQLWVLWFNYVPYYSYAVAVSRNASGPFRTIDTMAGSSFRYCNGDNTDCGDFSLFVDDDLTAYMMYSHHGTLSVARLSDDYLRSSWDPATGTGEMDHLIGGFEAPAMFKRGGIYYTLSSGACCYCGQGGEVRVHRSSAPLGPYVDQGSAISFGDGTLRTQGQQTTVSRVVINDEEHFIWQGDRWQSARDKLKAHDFQFWYPLSFDSEGNIQTMDWIDNFTLPSAGPSNGVTV